MIHKATVVWLKQPVRDVTVLEATCMWLMHRSFWRKEIFYVRTSSAADSSLGCRDVHLQLLRRSHALRVGNMTRCITQSEQQRTQVRLQDSHGVSWQVP
jgi:hypothetical protein